MLCLGVADKKQKRKKGQAQAKSKPEDTLSVVLYEDETQRQPVDPDLPNLQAWRPGRVLQIGDSRFSITYNPPTADKVEALSKACSKETCNSSQDSKGVLSADALLHIARAGSDIWKAPHWLPPDCISPGRSHIYPVLQEHAAMCPLTQCMLVQAIHIADPGAAVQVSFAPDEDCKWQWYRGGSSWTTGSPRAGAVSQPQQSRYPECCL